MNTRKLNNYRYIWLVLIVMISLGLVGVALAAAGQTGRSLAEAIPTRPQTQAGGQPNQALPPSPMQTSYKSPVVHSPPDPLLEQMRLQAMARSQVSSSDPRTENRSFLTDAQVGQTASSLGRSGVNGTYLPGDIVVDTYLNYIYGKLPVTGTVLINRADGAYGAAETDGVGFFWTYLYSDLNGGPLTIFAGDQLEININGDTTSITVDDQPSGYLYVTDDTVSGNIPNDTGGTVVSATLGLYGQPSTAYETRSVITEPDGSFTITFAPDVDLGPENFAFVDYKIGEAFQRTSFFPLNNFLLLPTNRIAGYAQMKTEIVATVYTGTTDVKWSGNIYADYPLGWYDFYLPDGWQINPGDKVEVYFPITGVTTEKLYINTSNITISPDGMLLSGTTDANVYVRVSYVKWNGDSYSYYENHTTSDGSGNFSVDLPEDGIRPDVQVVVAVIDPISGAGSYTYTGMPYIEVVLDTYAEGDCVMGRVNVPNTIVTLELERNGEVFIRDPLRTTPISDPGNVLGSGGCYLLWRIYPGEQESRPMNFEPGDILRWRIDNWFIETTVRGLHYGADANANVIDGSVFTPSLATGEIAFRLSQSYISYFPFDMGVEARAEVNDNAFTVQFYDTFDVRARVVMNSFLYDENGFAQQFTETNHFFRIGDDATVWGRTYIPDEEVTLTLWESGVPIYSSSDQDPDPYAFYFDLRDHRLQPGTMVEVNYQYSGDGDRWMVYEPLSVVGNFQTSVVTVTGHTGMIDVWGGYDQGGFDQMIPAKASQVVVNTTNYNYNLIWGDSLALAYPDISGNTHHAATILGEIQRVEFWSNPDGSTWIWGAAQPGYDVNIQVPGELMTRWADVRCGGCFDTDHPVTLQQDDIVTVSAGDGIYPVNIEFQEAWARSDSTGDYVEGNIGIPGGQVNVCPWWGEDCKTVTSDGDGYFSVTFNDVPLQGSGEINFKEEFGEAAVDAIFHRRFDDQVPTMQVNYAHDWVESRYDSGYTVAITVTNNAGELIDTAHGTTGVIPWWGGQTGFSTGYNVLWDGGVNPDIQVWDHVYLSMNGYTTDVELGEIGGVLDSEADTFEGYLNIPWLTDPVNGDCGIWIENGPGMGYGPVDPNGGTFTCDFTTLGWDLMPGMDVGVGYNDPSGNNVYNVFREPAPHLWINIEQQGEPAQGNNFALRIRYNNDGDGTAVGAIISQEFEGLTYLSDSSGFPSSGSGAPGDPIVWQLGDLPIYRWGDHWFDVFFTVDDPSSVSSMVDIDAAVNYYQGDPWSKHYEWGSEVVPNSTDLNIGTWPWTGDPVAGQEYVYVVNICNEGATASTEVIVTDTLPLLTSMVSWWSPDPGWELLDQVPTLIFSRPTLNGGRCSELDINVLLSDQAQPGDQLHNQAGVSSVSDLSPDNNYADNWSSVGSPYYNLHIGTNWVQGQFVPNGDISYEFWFSNWGNMPVTGAILTTTVPAGAEFLEANTWDWQGGAPFTPTHVTDQYIVWELDTIPNGYNYNIAVRMKLSDDIAPGTPLVVQNSILSPEIEFRYDDNVVIYTEKVNEAGPNLRVDKHTNWYWQEWWDEFNNKHQLLEYELRILNIGTQYLEDPIVTDTLPISVTFAGCGYNHGPFTGCGYNPDTHVVTYTLDYLNPGETASGMLKTDLLQDASMSREWSMSTRRRFPILVTLTSSDNSISSPAYTGPDVFVRKWLKSGEVRAGESDHLHGGVRKYEPMAMAQ